MRTIFISVLLLLGMSSIVSAQFKIGGKTINTKKIVAAGADVAKAITLTDADIASMSREYMVWMDANNPVAADDSEYGKRITRLTQNLKEIPGLATNFKVYEVVDVNAFACGDGSIRVCAGLMDVMTDDEVLAVMGHEIGHVYHTDSKDAMKSALLASAARNAAGVAGGVAQKLSDSQLGDIAQAFTGAQFSQKQEVAADDYAFEFCVANNINPYGMANALTKLVEMSNAGGAKSSAIEKMFSSHPDSEKRAIRMKAKADEYTKAQ